MIVTLSKEFTFEAAHFLPTFPEGHKCRRLHGHSFRIRVDVEGPVDEKQGYLIDYGQISRAIEPVCSMLDHYLLNDIAGLENPTAENISRWIYHKLKPSLALLSGVHVFETCTTGCRYDGR